jgi:glycerol-3-phosphate dehydrogenase (NAD(P)+)
MNITILGDGVWGKALKSIIDKNSQTVDLLGKGDSSLSTQVLIIAIPTEIISTALGQVTFEGNPIIINTSKGIDSIDHLFPFQIIKKKYPQAEYYSLAGPSFAAEVIESMPTIVNLGYGQERTNLKKMHSLFSSHFFHIKPTEGIEILELFSAFKNIYAIGSGIASGLGYKANTKTALTMVAYDEIIKLTKKMNLHLSENSTFGTLGDLLLTCNSEESRNFKFGKLLAQETVERSLIHINSTVEGYNTLRSISFFENKYNCSLPFAKFIHSVVIENNSKNLKENFLNYFTLIN